MRKFLAVLVMAGALATGIGSGQQTGRPEVALQAAIRKEAVEGDLKGAIEQYKKIAAQPGAGRATVATALLRMGQCHEKLGNAEASKAYERIVREFADQAEPVRVARDRLAALGTARRGKMVTRRVWEDRVVSFKGTASADGRYLSFVDWDTGDLAVHDFTSGQSRRLTGKGSWIMSDYASYSVISPDSKQVAYAWFNAKSRSWELRVIGIDGSGSRLLHSHPGVTYIQPADWSPNGKLILAGLVKKDKTVEAVLVSLADGSVRVIQTYKGANWFEEGHGERRARAMFSPDNQYIAHDRQRDIFVVDINTGQEVSVIQHPADDALLGWGQDGKSIMFLSDRGQTTDIWMIDVVDGKPGAVPRLLRKDVGKVIPLGLTKAGSLYYGISADAYEVYVAEFDLVTGKRTGGPERATGRFVNSAFIADWSPDGKRLAYLLDRPGGPRIIVIRSVETGEEREVLPKINLKLSLRWHPDARSFILRGSSEKGEGLFRVDAQTGEASFLAPSDYSSLGGVDCSADGASVFYASDNPDLFGNRILRVRDLKTGQETELARDNMFDFSLSPDGRRVLFMRPGDPQRLMTMPATGGQATELVRGQDDEVISAFAWARDSRHVIFAKNIGRLQGSTMKFGLWRVSAEGGESQPLDLTADGMLRALRVHPDGRRFAYGVLKFMSEVWVMENFLSPFEAKKREMGENNEKE